jgi:rod shape determining protein RodA
MTTIRRVNLDWPLIGTAFVLSLFGLAAVYSAGDTEVHTYVRYAWRLQLVWLVVAILGAYLISRASVRLVEWMAWPLYLFSVFLLLLVFVPGFGSGAGTAAGVKGWLTIAGHRIGQPAEIAKLTVVMMLAVVLSKNKEAPKSMMDLWKPALVVGIPWLLIMKQPDLGTGIVFVGIFFGMLLWTGVEWRLLLLIASPVISLILAFNTAFWGAWFILLMILLVWYKPYVLEGVLLATANVFMGVVAPILWERLAPYQQNRLRVFLDPSIDPRRSGYHVIQSQVAIGSGGWFGKGYLQGPQKRLAFLPAQHTDFIWAVVGEELGFIGVTLGLALFLVLFLRVVRIAERANDSFSSLLAFGLLSSWFIHMLENIAMTINLAPITGIPLPFFSYGGSFMLSSWLAIGILVRISSEGRGGRTGELAV